VAKKPKLVRNTELLGASAVGTEREQTMWVKKIIDELRYSTVQSRISNVCMGKEPKELVVIIQSVRSKYTYILTSRGLIDIFFLHRCD
jgi:hypothetical protein